MPMVDYKAYECTHCGNDAEAVGKTTNTNAWTCRQCGPLTRDEVRVADGPPPLQEFIDWETPVADRLPCSDGPLRCGDLLCRWNGKHLSVYGIVKINQKRVETLKQSDGWLRNHHQDMEELVCVRDHLESEPTHNTPTNIQGFHTGSFTGDRTEGDARQWGTALLPRPTRMYLSLQIGGHLHVNYHVSDDGSQKATDGGGDSVAP